MTNATIQATPAAHSVTESIHAQPLSGGQGFYFASLTDYQQRAALLAGRGIEEWELSYCDGEHAELFEAAGVSQANIEQWYSMLEEVEDYNHPALFYLLDCLCYDLAEALPLVEDVMVFEGSPEDYAEELTDDMGALDAVPETLRYYIDYKALARDMVLGGDITEVRFNGTDYVMSGV